MRLLYNIWGVRKFLLISQNLLFNIVYKGKLGNRVAIYGFPIFSIAKHSQIKVGKGLVLISESYFSEVGVNHPVIIRTLNSDAKITIGDNVGISGGCICAVENITIGNSVMIGANSSISDNDFHPMEPGNRRFWGGKIVGEKVVIEDNVFIGMDCVVLKGVTIGTNSVIGAGSVVAKNIPQNCIAAGIPAKVIKVIV